MITLKDYLKKEISSCFLFKKTLILSLLLWICQYWNNEGTISKTLHTGHSIDTTLDLRHNRLLGRHELITKVDEEGLKEQLGYNTRRKSVLLKGENQLDKEAAERGKVKSGNSSKSEDEKCLNLKFGHESKKEKGKNGNLKIKSELKNGNKIKNEEKEKKQGQKGENVITVEVGETSDDRRSENELTEADAKAEVGTTSDDQRSENELTEADAKAELGAESDDQRSDNKNISTEKVEVEGDEQTGKDKLVYEVEEVNVDEECENKEPKKRAINVEVFLEKKEEKKGKVNIELILQKALEDKDELINNDDDSKRKESIENIAAEGDDDKLGNLDSITPDVIDDRQLEEDEIDDKKLKSKLRRKKIKKKIIFVLKKFGKILRYINIIGLIIEKINKRIDKYVEKLMFKAYGMVDEYKKDPSISKREYQLINFAYKAFFFIIPIMIIAIGIVISQVSNAPTFVTGFIIMMGISFFIGNIKRSIRYQFKRKGIENPGFLDYLDLLEKFLMKFEKEEEHPEGDIADGENAEGENTDGENTDGENTDGENTDGEEELPQIKNLSDLIALIMESRNS